MRILLLLLVLLAAALLANAAAFQNGSFEIGPTAPVHPCACGGGVPYIGTFFAPYTGITGWTVTSGSVDIIFSPGWSASDGLRSIDLDGLSAGTMTQAFDTAPGTTYEVDFDLAANFYAGQRVKHVLVTAPGFSQAYSFDSAGRTALSMGWETHTFEFVAASSSSSLSFADTDASSAFGPALDNVRVSAVIGSVPEPSTWLLVGAGIGLRIVITRKRFRSQKRLPARL